MVRYGMVLDLRSCLGCKACMAACAMENQTPYWEKDINKWRTKVLDVEYMDRIMFFSTICMHCENPPCVSVCPTGASHIDEKNGRVVLVNYDRCIGCGYCIIACPYNARYRYEKHMLEEGKKRFQTYIHKVPHVDKCTFCIHRLTDENLKEEFRAPACVTTCPGQVRIFGDLDDPNSEVYKLVKSGKARPLYPELGTHPKVYYIF